MNGNLHFSSIAFRSEVGLHRDGNEDSGLAAHNLIAVADGMGGYAGGEVASSTAIKTLAQFLPVINSAEVDSDSRDDLLRASLVDIDRAIRAVTSARPELVGMGTTLTSLALFGDQITMLHIGDSRAYRIRGKTITRLSQDHTVVQELLDQGRISHEEVGDHPQRSFLTQALMGKEDIEPILQVFSVEIGDKYLVCSDGLTNVVAENEIRQACDGALEDAIAALIDLTYQKGAPDNVTILAAEIGRSNCELETTLIGAAS